MASRWGKVVVGLDAREESRDALALADRLAAADGAELHVAVVHPRGEVPFERALVREPVSSQLDERLYAEAKEQLGERDFVEARLDGGLSGRSAARALYEYADEQGAGLIVAGSSHRGPVGRVLAGSVGESLLRGAPCAVAIAPREFAGTAAEDFSPIGVAWDGTPESELALREAEWLAQALGARLRLITVVPELAPPPIQAPNLEEIHESIRRSYRETLDRGVAAAGGDAEAVLAEGAPDAALRERAAELGLLAIGSRGYGRVRGVVAGTVSAGVVRDAPCPVIVTPRASG